MDQSTSPTGTAGFWDKYGNYIVAGAIVLLLVIVYFATKKTATNDPESKNEQALQQNTQPGQNQTLNGATRFVGNVPQEGVLKPSDNPEKGNLMLESGRGKIYISTQRDFSSLSGQKVVLNAEGSLESFVFLGFYQSIPKIAVVENPPQAETNLSLSGILQNSDNLEKGNYVIASEQGKIYLQSERDYSAWIEVEVSLSAKGTVQSFTEAVLTKK